MTAKQRPYILLSLYSSLFEKKYGRKPEINRHRDKWGFADMIDDLGMDRAREVIEWFFETEGNHSLRTLFSSYDRMSSEIQEESEDKQRLAQLRLATKDKVAEFRRRKFEQSRGESPSGGNRE